MNSIGSLLTSGISAKKILDFFIRKSPEMGQKIQSLLAQGFTAEKILKFFSKGNNTDKLRNEIESQYQTENNANPLVQAENIRSQNLGTDMTSAFQRNAGPVLGTAAAGLTGYALSRAVPAIAQKLAPGIMQGGILAPPTTSGEPIPEVGAQTPQQELPTIAPTPQLQQPQDALWDKVQSGDINIEGKKDDFLLAARGIRKQGGLQTKEEFDSFFQDYMANKDKYQGPALVNYLRNQFKQGYGKVEPIKPQEKAPTAHPETETIGNLALLPKGDIGQIESIKNGIARVNVDGKITNRKLEDLEQEPSAIKDIDYKKIASDYIASIPESEISTAMLMSYFVPKSQDKLTGEFHVIFPSDPYHMGIYKNVTKEQADKIYSASTAPKTTGKTALGKYTAGTADSRGSPMTELRINPEKYPYEKIPIPYNLSKRMYEAVKVLNQEEAKRQSEEKKALKKKEKENAPKKPKKPKK